MFVLFSRPVKSTLDCLAGTNGECPGLIRMYEASILDTMYIDWVRVKEFTRTECPKFPKCEYQHTISRLVKAYLSYLCP